jgi:cobalt/nickel transport system permease protein
MHLGNGTFTPECAAIGFGAAALGIGMAWTAARSRGGAGDLKARAGDLPLATAAVFAAQTLNVTVIPHAVSGHLIGGFLLAYGFGPLRAMLGMGVVLAAQSLLFADGGLMSWGWNFVTMGCVPCLIVYPLWRRWSRGRSGLSGRISVAAAGWASVVLGSLVCSLVLLSHPAARTDPLATCGLLVGVHALIGLLEGGITLAVIVSLPALGRRISRRRIWGTLAMAAGMLGLLGLATSPWASQQPDGLAYSLERLGLTELTGGWAALAADLQARLAPWPDYQNLPGALSGALLCGLAVWILSRAALRSPAFLSGKGES